MFETKIKSSTENLSFSFRLGDIELRTKSLWEIDGATGKYAETNELDMKSPAEVVKWFDKGKNADGKETCYTLLYWIRDSEGYDMRFVGNRPFIELTADEISTLWPIMDAMQKFLDALFDSEDNR